MQCQTITNYKNSGIIRICVCVQTFWLGLISVILIVECIYGPKKSHNYCDLSQQW